MPLSAGAGILRTAMRKLGIGLGAAAAIGAAVFFVARRGDGDRPRYQSAAVELGDLVESVTATGTLEARVTVQIGSQVSGTIEELTVDYNDAVKAGEVLARIDPSLFEAEAAQARATLALAEADAERARLATEQTERDAARAVSLAKEGYEATAGLDQRQFALATARAEARAAQARVAQARAALDRTAVNLRHTVIRSPIDGVVISRSIDVGQTVAASLQAPTLFRIAADLRKMELQVNVDEADVGRLREGQAGRFQVDAFHGQEFSGTLRQVRNASVTIQNVVTYTAVLDVENPDLALRPGMTTNVTIETARKHGVLKVANAALRFRPPLKDGEAPPKRSKGAPGEGKLYTLAGETLRPIAVRVGITDGESTEVSGDGIAAGGMVVTGVAGEGEKAAEGHKFRVRF